MLLVLSQTVNIFWILDGLSDKTASVGSNNGYFHRSLTHFKDKTMNFKLSDLILKSCLVESVNISWSGWTGSPVFYKRGEEKLLLLRVLGFKVWRVHRWQFQSERVVKEEEFQQWQPGLRKNPAWTESTQHESRFLQLFSEAFCNRPHIWHTLKQRRVGESLLLIAGSHDDIQLHCRALRRKNRSDWYSRTHQT